MNLASRLESLNKILKTEILLSAATRQIAGSAFPGSESRRLAKVAGLEESVAVYTVRVPASATQEIKQPAVVAESSAT